MVMGFLSPPTPHPFIYLEKEPPWSAPHLLHEALLKLVMNQFRLKFAFGQNHVFCSFYLNDHKFLKLSKPKSARMDPKF